MSTHKRPPRRQGNPDDSPWRNTPVAKRHRKPYTAHLPEEVIAAADEHAERHYGGNRSRMIEALLRRETGLPPTPEEK